MAERELKERRKSERAPLGPGRAKVDVMDRRTGKAWRECVDDTDRQTLRRRWNRKKKMKGEGSNRMGRLVNCEENEFDFVVSPVDCRTTKVRKFLDQDSSHCHPTTRIK